MRTRNLASLASITLVSLGLAASPGCGRAPTDASDEPLGSAAEAASATCITLQRGVSGTVKDALLNSLQPDKAFGGTGSLTAGVSSGAAREGLLAFDLSMLAPGTTITSATLTLNQLLPSGVAKPVRIHRALAPWTEATVTWNSFGGARAAQVEAQIPAVPAFTYASTDITSLVQSWVDGTPNHGVLLERDLDGSTVYATSEGIAAQRPALQVCYVPPFCQGKADGTACDDGNACTTGDACQGGVCGGAPVVCSAPDACHAGGTCDPTTGQCAGAPALADGTACDDGNACTTGDACHAGVCGGSPVVCSAPDACHAGGTCNPSTGVCGAAPALADGTACSDGDASTSGDRCLSGVCAPTATCADGVKNQGEAGVDCGGPCAATCNIDPSASGVVLLLHADGTSGSTSFPDAAGHTVSVLGQTHVDTAQSRFGGGSAYFDGNGDAIKTPTSASFDFSGSQPFTMEMWVNGTGTILSADSYGPVLSIKGGNLYVWFVGVTAWTYAGTFAGAVSPGWHHIAVSYSGTTYGVFIDGVQTWTANGTMSSQPNAFILFGAYQSGTQPYFQGYMDEIRLTKGVGRYPANFTPPTLAFPDP